MLWFHFNESMYSIVSNIMRFSQITPLITMNHVSCISSWNQYYSWCAKNNVYRVHAYSKEKTKANSSIVTMLISFNEQKRYKRFQSATVSPSNALKLTFWLSGCDSPPQYRLKKICFHWITQTNRFFMEYFKCISLLLSTIACFIFENLVSYHLKSSTRRVAIRKHYLINNLWTIWVCNIS